MRHAMLIPLTALALGACGGGDVALTNASPAEVAREVDAAGGVRFKPGKWEMTVQTISVDIPGLDGELEKQMTETVMKRVQTTTSCVSRKQAMSPPAEVIARSQGRCKYETFAMDEGRIDGTLVCEPQGTDGAATGGTMSMRVAGTINETAFAIGNDMKAKPRRGPAMRIKAKSNGKRIGDCTAAEERAADAQTS